MLEGVERFFYYGTLRFAEVDLSVEGKVYQTVIQNGGSGPLPTEPELWVINPATHQAVKYTSGPGNPPLRELTDAGLAAWLAGNSIPSPPADRALDIEVAWRELERLAKLQDANGGAVDQQHIK